MQSLFEYCVDDLREIGLAHLADADAGPLDIDTLIVALGRCDDLGTWRGHVVADLLLLRYIGDERVTAAFDELEKWYA